MAPMEGGNSGQGLSQYASDGLNQYGEPVFNSTAYQGEALTLVPICIFLVVVRMTGPITTLGVCPTGPMTTLLCVSNIRLTPIIGYFFSLLNPLPIIIPLLLCLIPPRHRRSTTIAPHAPKLRPQRSVPFNATGQRERNSACTGKNAEAGRKVERILT